jgi:hypothetical protein
VNKSRNYRLDLIRGLALLIIYIDHVTNSWVHNVTPQGWQISDFAEVFVFISGFSASLAYARQERAGIGAVAARSFRRAWKLYRWYLLSLAATLLTVYLALSAGLPVLGSALRSFQQAPWSYALGALYFRGIPNMFSVWALYIVLLLALPVISWCGRRSLAALLLLSAGLYICAQIFAHGGRPTGPEEWTFKPLAWQILFVAGYVWPRIHWPRWVHSRLLFWAGAGIVVACAMLMLASLSVPFHLRGASKDSVAILRLLNFTGWILVVHRFWSRLPKITWLMTCGRHSLALFCGGAWLAVVSALVIAGVHANSVVQFVVVAAGSALLVWQAHLLEGWRAKGPARALEATAPEDRASAHTLLASASCPDHSPGLPHEDPFQTI